MHQPVWTFSLLLRRCLSGGLGQDTSLGNEHNMLPTKLLLQLSHQTGLDLLEVLQLWHRHEDYDGLQAMHS